MDPQKILSDTELDLTDEERERITAEAPVDEPVDEPAPVAEPEANPEPEAKPRKEKPTWLKRVDDEKAAREAAEKKLADLEAKHAEAATKAAKMEERFADLMAKLVPPAPQQRQEAAQIPDPDVDPFGHLVARLQQQEQTIKQLASAAQMSAVEREMDFGVQVFSEKSPDYKKAMIHLSEHRFRELQTLGYTSHEIMEVARRDVMEAHERGKRIGKTGAQIMYEWAKQRGYAAQSDAPVADTSGADDLDRINRGQREVQGLTNPGNNGSQSLTLAAIADDPEAYSAFVSKYGGLLKAAKHLAG